MHPKQLTLAKQRTKKQKRTDGRNKPQIYQSVDQEMGQTSVCVCIHNLSKQIDAVCVCVRERDGDRVDVMMGLSGLMC